MSSRRSGRRTAVGTLVALIWCAAGSGRTVAATGALSFESLTITPAVVAYPTFALIQTDVQLTKSFDTTQVGANGFDEAVIRFSVVDSKKAPAVEGKVTLRIEGTDPDDTKRDAINGPRPPWYQVHASFEPDRTTTKTEFSIDAKNHGKASIRCFASDVGGNDVSGPGSERITLTLMAPDGALLDTRTLFLLTGYECLRKVSPTKGGLQFSSNTVQAFAELDFAQFLDRLGSIVAAAKWPFPVTVTELSKSHGGHIYPHGSHKTGLISDMRPASTDGNEASAGKPNRKSRDIGGKYDRERTRDLILFMRDAGCKNVLFNDQDIPQAQYWQDHHDHFHTSFERGSPKRD